MIWRNDIAIFLAGVIVTAKSSQMRRIQAEFHIGGWGKTAVGLKIEFRLIYILTIRGRECEGGYLADPMVRMGRG